MVKHWKRFKEDMRTKNVRVGRKGGVGLKDKAKSGAKFEKSKAFTAKLNKLCFRIAFALCRIVARIVP
jgi:hypothetical protein